MNGRVYDPKLGRFLSPDPFVQSPGRVAGFNRYAYVMNNPLKYTDPSGYIFQGPVEPEAPYWTAGGTMIQVPYQGIIPSGGYSVGTVDWLGSFDVAHKSAMNQIGFSRRIVRRMAVNFALRQLKRNRKKVIKAEIMGNFLVFTTCPSPKNLISNMQLIYHEEFGIYVQRDKSTGDFYQPYSNIKVDPGALVYNAKLKAFLKSMSGGAGHGAANGGGPGPEFSGSFGDWVNKINHLGRRKWTDPESGISYYINDAGDISGVYPITGIAPAPGKIVKAPSTIRKTVVIGENMAERVIPYANKYGFSYFKPRGTNPANWMRNQTQWIRRQIQSPGTRIIDIGPDPSRAIRSNYYLKELDQ